MALSFTDKLRLQGEANAIKKELKSGSLGFMAKLTKQAEWKAVIDQLKGAATPPVAESAPAIEPELPLDEEGTDEEAEQAAGRSLVGFRLAGVHHPKWALKFENGNTTQAADLVVSNDQLEVCVLWQPTSGTGRDALLIGWPRNLKGTNKEGAGHTIKASTAWDGVKSPFPPILRKKVRYMVGQAEREVARALKEGVAEFSVSVESAIRPLVLMKDGRSASDRTVAGAAAKYGMMVNGKDGLMAAAQDGQIYTLSIMVHAQLDAVNDGRADGTALPTVAEWDALIAATPEDSLDDFMREKLADIRQKLVERTPEGQQEGQQDGAGGDLPAPEGDDSQKSAGGIVERYIAGDFVDAPYSEFRAAVIEVEKAGATFEQIQSGAVEWVEASSELIQQAA